MPFYGSSLIVEVGRVLLPAFTRLLLAYFPLSFFFAFIKSHSSFMFRSLLPDFLIIASRYLVSFIDVVVHCLKNCEAEPLNFVVYTCLTRERSGSYPWRSLIGNDKDTDLTHIVDENLRREILTSMSATSLLGW